MDTIIKFIKENPSDFPGVTLKYSTLSRYFESVHQHELKHYAKAKENNNAEGPLFGIFEGDFFPYADNGDSYWTVCKFFSLLYLHS